MSKTRITGINKDDRTGLYGFVVERGLRATQAGDQLGALRKLLEYLAQGFAGTAPGHDLLLDEAERVTGYQVGGISPLGSRRRLRTFVDESAASLPMMMLNAGARGLIVEAGTEALLAHLGAAVVPLCR